MPLQTGQVLNNRYRVVRLLGQGGFGAVYRAWDANLNRPCAVKENLDTSPEAQRQFTREATVLANLSHPNLPRVTDHFILPDQGQYLIMDFVEGEDLAGKLKRQGTPPIDQVIQWLSQVADALTYLHSRQPPVVHRDIKPANIRITPEGKAMLVDFGLVKFYNPNLRTTLGARAVTPGYAPPEQYGHGNTDSRTDIYALGATMYNLLTGLEPLESVQRIAGAQMKQAHLVNPLVSTQVGQAVDQAMRLEPSQRFQSAAEFKSALKAPAPVVGTVVARPQPEIYVRPAVQAPVKPTPVSFPPVSKTRENHSKISMWVGVGTIVVLCLTAAIILGAWMVKDNQDTVKATSDFQLQQTLAERVQTTSTAQYEATRNFRTPVVTKPESSASYIATLEATGEIASGPSSGELTHNPEDTQIETVGAKVKLKDLITEARFFNPYSLDKGPWDYGFIFRHEAANMHYRFVVKSDRTWTLFNNNGDPNGEIISQGEVPSLNVDENGSNLIRLVIKDAQGWFLLNGEIIYELDLSDRVNSGDVFVVTGVYQGDEIPGSATRFQDFSIWSIK
jgi:serine/threonine protein kinase